MGPDVRRRVPGAGFSLTLVPRLRPHKLASLLSATDLENPLSHPRPRAGNGGAHPVRGGEHKLLQGIFLRAQRLSQGRHHVRAGATETLDHNVRGGSHQNVLAPAHQLQQFMDRPVGFLNIVNHNQLKPAALGRQELRIELQERGGCRDDTGRVKGA